MRMLRHHDSKLALLPCLLVSPLALLASCGSEVGGNSSEPVGQSEQALVGISNEGFSINWTQVGQPNLASKIAACDKNIVYALNTDFRLYRNTNSGADASWTFVDFPFLARSIACIGSLLYALNENKDLYYTSTTGPISWRWVGRPTGAEHLGGGYGLLYALNFDKSIWTSDVVSADDTEFLPGADSLWRRRWTGQTNVRRVTGAMAHPDGQLKRNNTRTFVLNADRTISYRDDVFSTSTFPIDSGVWRPVQAGALAFSEIAAGDSNVLYGLDLSKRLWKGEIKETGCYDKTDNDNDSLIDEADFTFCKVLPGDATARVGVSCDAGLVSDAFTELCNTFPGCSSTRDCATRQLDVFTGTVLSTATTGNWSGYGGPGRHLGELALCLLRDFNQTANSISIGANSTVSQKVGRLTFDPANRTLTGYRRLSFEVPAFGRIDTRAQKFTTKLVTTSLPSISVDGTSFGLYAGDYRITEAAALSTTIDETYQNLEVRPRSFVVPTPYGALTFDLTYSYTASNPVVSSPYGSSTSTIADIVPGASVSLRDIQGRSVGAKYTDDSNWRSEGWASQIAGGSRVLSIWNGQGNRPEHDVGTARSFSEYGSTGSVFAGAKVSEDVTWILPAALRSAGFDPSVVVSIEPYYSMDVGGDFQLYFAEKARELLDVSSVSNSQMLIRAGFSGKASYNFRFAIDIVVDFGLFNVVNYHYSTTQTLGAPKPSKFVQMQTAAYTSSSSPNLGWAYNSPGVKTLTGAAIPDPKAYVTTCLSSPPPAPNTLPPADYSPGDPNDLMPDSWPCNICIWQKPTTTSSSRGHQIVPSSPAPGWKCDSAEKAAARCQDLCSYDPVTKAVRVTSQNRDIACFAPPPPPPPH